MNDEELLAALLSSAVIHDLTRQRTRKSAGIGGVFGITVVKGKILATGSPLCLVSAALIGRHKCNPMALTSDVLEAFATAFKVSVDCARGISDGFESLDLDDDHAADYATGVNIGVAAYAALYES